MPVARTTDPQTSHDAARSVENITETQNAILTLLTFPLTDEELIDAFYNMADVAGWKTASPSGIRSRRAELVAKGFIKDSGERRKLSSGRNAIVWSVA
jgi:hypothetical protein